MNNTIDTEQDNRETDSVSTILEPILGEWIDERAFYLMQEATAPNEDNLRIARLKDDATKARLQLIESVNNVLEKVSAAHLLYAGEAMLTFYRQGVYNGVEIAAGILDNTDKGQPVVLAEILNSIQCAE